MKLSIPQKLRSLSWLHALFLAPKKPGSVFEERFGVREYIEMYYPQIADVEKLLEIAEAMHKNVKGHYVIDELARETNTQPEVIENVAIFDFYRVVTEHFMEEFPKGDAQILDIGGGPTIYQHIGLSLIAGHITHSEYLEKNREEVLSWLRAEESAHVWDRYFELVQRLFIKRELEQILQRLVTNVDIETARHARDVQRLLQPEGLEDFKHHVRGVIGDDVVHGDVFKSDLGLEDGGKLYDLVTSNFVAESVTESITGWETAMEHMISRIKPGGYFAQTAIRNASWYQVGDERLPAAPVDEKSITQVCEKFGCSVLYQKILDGSDKEATGYDGMVFTLARKVA